MKIIWDDYDPSQHAFQSGRTPDDKIWVEVYAYPEPEDMRRYRYQVNIWHRRDYTLGQPLHSFDGRGGIKSGKFAAEEYLREHEIKR